jgi:hypothetical protein
MNKRPDKPTKYTPELFTRLCDEIAEGKSLRQACLPDDMPDRACVRRWMIADPELATQYTRAREERAELYADEIMEIADNAQDPQIAKLQVDARKWIASKMLPKVYGDKTHTDITSNGNTIAVAPIKWADE